MRITRFPSISDLQFQGCVSAFLDTFFGELNATAQALRRLEGMKKGAAFAYEMTLDTRRYGALIVLDRWATVLRAFRPERSESLERAASAEDMLRRVNQLIDNGETYSTEMVQACELAFQSIQGMFQPESVPAPLVSEEYTAARGIFLEDLAAR